MSEILKILKEKYVVTSENTSKYYLSLDARKYLGTINLPEGSENNETFLNELNEFLGKLINCKAIFAKVNIYIMQNWNKKDANIY